jgi:glycosyltransferase involved in cell wall biosynthesis
MDQRRPRISAVRQAQPDIVNSPSVSVVIPTLNEARNLPHVFSRLPVGPLEVIIVDGGSADDTIEVARKLRPDVVIAGQSRTGKGNALACGMMAATGDIVVLLDADGSTDPAEIPLFVESLVGGADYVKGSRVLPGGGSDDLTSWRRFGNASLTRVMNALFRTDFTDSCYGYNSLWRHHVKAFDLDITPAQPDEVGRRWGDGFEIEVLLHARAASGGLRIAEVPSVERTRIFGESNLHAIRDGVRILRTIVREYRGSQSRKKARQGRVVIELNAAHLRHSIHVDSASAAHEAIAFLQQYAQGEAEQYAQGETQ